LRRTASLTAVLWAFQYQMSMDGLAIQHRGARFRKPLSRKSSLRFSPFPRTSDEGRQGAAG
jgi:hypothetical protein